MFGNVGKSLLIIVNDPDKLIFKKNSANFIYRHTVIPHKFESVIIFGLHWGKLIPLLITNNK
jgi:hypothetical protein